MMTCRVSQGRPSPAPATAPTGARPRSSRRGLAAIGLAGIALLTACAHGPRPAAAAAAPAEVVFNRTDAGAVSALIAGQCRTMGWSVDRADLTSITCTANVTTPQRILSAMTMRNTQRQTRMESHHFMLSQSGSDVSVRSESWFSDPDRGQRRELKRSRAAQVEKQMAGFLVLLGGHLSNAAAEP